MRTLERMRGSLAAWFGAPRSSRPTKSGGTISGQRAAAPAKPSPHRGEGAPVRTLERMRGSLAAWFGAPRSSRPTKSGGTISGQRAAAPAKPSPHRGEGAPVRTLERMRGRVKKQRQDQPYGRTLIRPFGPPSPCQGEGLRKGCLQTFPPQGGRWRRQPPDEGELRGWTDAPIPYRLFRTPLSSLKALMSASRASAWWWTASQVCSVSYQRASSSSTVRPCCSTQV